MAAVQQIGDGGDAGAGESRERLPRQFRELDDAAGDPALALDYGLMLTLGGATDGDGRRVAAVGREALEVAGEDIAVWAAEAGQEQADPIGAAAAQALGGVVGDVVEFVHRGEDADPGRLAHAAVADPAADIKGGGECCGGRHRQGQPVLVEWLFV